ncbi:MAG: OsmC family protein [Armatimonadota bacterium]|nr:OsmC family protein [Armatimonadota bacterium]MDR5703466.1 OsmC family protein [Armatimonadota bacterium]
MRFDGFASSGSSITLDAHPDHGGSGAGPTPMESVLIALAGCTGMDVVSILRKMRAPLAGMRIEVNAQRAPEHPKVFTQIHVRYVAWGEGLQHDQVEKAATLSQEKYCSVSAMLKKTADLTYEVVVADHDPEA